MRSLRGTTHIWQRLYPRLMPKAYADLGSGRKFLDLPHL